MSSQVRSIGIFQTISDSVCYDVTYLLGNFGADWTSIILDMFSRKLDKLYITSSYSMARFLNDDHANNLIKVYLLSN